MRQKVLLLEGIHSLAKKHFEVAGCQVELIKQALCKEELIKKASKADVLGIRSKTCIDEDVIKSLPNLKVLGCYIIGLNKVDIAACQEAGVNVFNAPYSSSRSVAELAIGSIIGLLRKIYLKNAQMHQGIWEKSAEGCFEVRGKKLGIIGYGNIGSQVSILAEEMGMDVLFYDIKDKMPLGKAQKAKILNKVLNEADVVTLHVDENETSLNMINKDALKQMKKGSYLINLSRGTVVVIEDLVRFLSNGHLAGAALDVYPKEPSSNDEVFESELRGAGNVILLPHIGASTQEAQEDIAISTTEKIIRYLEEGSTLGSVNFPQAALNKKNGGYRFIHIHRNVPGVLSKLNNIIAREKINIDGQHLSTKGEIGYTVIDINKKPNRSLIEEIEKINETIKVMVN